MMNDSQALAKRRVKLKRYLALMEIDVPNNISTKSLMALVKVMHKSRGKRIHAWPMSSESIERLAKEEFFANQLVSLKVCFGIKATIGIVDDKDPHGKKNYGTMAELVRDGHCSKRMLVIDDNLDRLKVLGS
jgi:hypothetical protein